jgi:YesN/AraC family two-component response regulator
MLLVLVSEAGLHLHLRHPDFAGGLTARRQEASFRHRATPIGFHNVHPPAVSGDFIRPGAAEHFRDRRVGRVPIILVGGKRSFHLARKALLRKVSDYLPDPVSSEELLRSLLSVRRELEQDSTGFFNSARENAQALTFSTAGRVARPPDDIIDQVKAYVKHSLRENITLKEIARSLHFNCSYLGQKFKEHEKMTFNEYLLRQRMERAKTLLAHTRMKVYEIANQVGYSDLDWFYKKFKSYTGVSANQYRKMSSDTA